MPKYNMQIRAPLIVSENMNVTFEEKIIKVTVFAQSIEHAKLLLKNSLRFIQTDVEIIKGDIKGITIYEQ